MIAVNTKEKEELFKLKDNIGTRTNMVMNKFKVRIRRRFLITRTVWFSLPAKMGTMIIKLKLDKCIKENI